MYLYQNRRFILARSFSKRYRPVQLNGLTAEK